MALRKTTTDSSFRYIPKSEQTKETKQNPIKNNSPPRKQNKSISQNNKKLLKNIAAQIFGFLE